MQNQMKRQTSVSGGWGLGVFLIVAGIVFLLAQFLPYDIGQNGWPLFVIMAGAAFMIIGLTSRGAAGFVVPGSIVSVGLWAAWSYAWALVFPFAVGLGIALLGMQLNQPEQVRTGTRMAGMGIVLFLVFGAFFEGILHVSGYDIGFAGNVVMPLVLIFAGVVLIVLRTATGRPDRYVPPAPPVAPPPPLPPGGGGVA
jgi:hypothetical protein